MDQISVGLFVQTLACNNIFTFALLSPVFLEELVGALTQKFHVNSTLSPLISSLWHATATQLVQHNTFNKGSPFLTSSSLPQVFPPTLLRCHKTFERCAIRAACEATAGITWDDWPRLPLPYCSVDPEDDVEMCTPAVFNPWGTWTQ